MTQEAKDLPGRDHGAGGQPLPEEGVAWFHPLCVLEFWAIPFICDKSDLSSSIVQDYSLPPQFSPLQHNKHPRCGVVFIVFRVAGPA